MFNSTLMEFDLGLLGESPFAEPSSLSEHVADDKILQQHMVEEDKRMLEDNTNWLEATSDLQSFIDIGCLPEVGTKEDIDCQSVINDVDKLLSQIAPTATDVDRTNAPFKDMSTSPIEAFSEEEMAAAEGLLDELLKSNGAPQFDLLDECKEEEEEEQSIVQPKVEVENLDDSGFVDMTNVSKIITEDGQEVFIIIAPPSPATTTSVVAPESVATIDSDDSDEWTPDSPKSSKGRPMVQRSVKRTNRKSPYIKDKKERKKQQNVEAARRYRDKKKVEQSEVETEEQALCSRNKKLKSQVQELEAEVKTMKKLMLELNILKA